MNHRATRLGEAMRREADTLTVGPPPMAAVLREGRRRRRRRRQVVTGAVATAVVACLAHVVLLQSLPYRLSAEPASAPPAVTSSHPAPHTPSASTSGMRVVRPYEPVAIGRGALMGLLPEGRQNYVVACCDMAEEKFRQEVERARHQMGDNIRPDSLSGGTTSSERGVLITGAFRLATEPARITVTADGRTWEAGLLRLPGDPGWGAYHADAGRSGFGENTATVTAYGPDGTVLARLSLSRNM